MNPGIPGIGKTTTSRPRDIEMLELGCTAMAYSLSGCKVSIFQSRFITGQLVIYLVSEAGTRATECIATPLTGFRADLYQYQVVGIQGDGPIGSLSAPFIVGLLLASV